MAATSSQMRRRSRSDASNHCHQYSAKALHVKKSLQSVRDAGAYLHLLVHDAPRQLPGGGANRAMP